MVQRKDMGLAGNITGNTCATNTHFFNPFSAGASVRCTLNVYPTIFRRVGSIPTAPIWEVIPTCLT